MIIENTHSTHRTLMFYLIQTRQLKEYQTRWLERLDLFEEKI